MPISVINKMLPSRRFTQKKVMSKRQKGFSLIEVMVSLFLISMGLISLTNLQTQSVKTVMVAYTETQSSLYLQELVQLLRANKIAATNGDYNISLSLFSELNSSGTSVAETDRYSWFKNMNNTLPNAKAAISCTVDSNCVLKLQHSISSIMTKQSLAVIL